MQPWKISQDGDYQIGGAIGLSGVENQLSSESMVGVESNIDAATLTFGYYSQNLSGFFAFTDGVKSSAGTFHIKHGIGTKLMVRISGITSNAVSLSVSR